MLKNNFANAPTVGSHDADLEIKKYKTRVAELEKQLSDTNDSLHQTKCLQKSKIKWEKVKNFLFDVVVPILAFIPRLINAVSRYKAIAMSA